MLLTIERFGIYEKVERWKIIFVRAVRLVTPAEVHTRQGQPSLA